MNVSLKHSRRQSLMFSISGHRLTPPPTLSSSAFRLVSLCFSTRIWRFSLNGLPEDDSKHNTMGTKILGVQTLVEIFVVLFT